MSVSGWELILFCLALVVWCFLHSFLVMPRVSERFKVALGARYRYFRLFYNLWAVISLLPLYLWYRSLSGDPILAWQGKWHLLQGTLWAMALYLFYAGTRIYDLGEFLGLSQLRRDSGGRVGEGLMTGGILAWVRHPWYLGGFLVIWARDLTLVDLLAGAVFSLYLVVGSRLEEHKLVAEFGEAYRRYQREVPRFLPLRPLWVWIKRRVATLYR